VNRTQIPYKKALSLGIGLVACTTLVLIASSLTSMSEMGTRLVNEGSGILCELGRHTSQEVHKPYLPSSRWYVDLSSGSASELTEADTVAMGLRLPHSSLHSLFRVRQDMIVRQRDEAFDDAVEMAMLPVVADGKIKEFVLDRQEYSLRATGAGENFRIEWHSSPQSSTSRVPVELLMHAFLSEPAERIITFSSRGVVKGPNILVRDINDPATIIAQWRQSASCPPWCDAETICTLSEDQTCIEKRSLRNGALLESIPLTKPLGSSVVITQLDMGSHLFSGSENRDNGNGCVVVDFRTGEQIGFFPDTYALDFSPASKCVLLQPLSKPSNLRSVVSINTRKKVNLEGVTETELATLHLLTRQPRVVAVMRDGSIRMHSLPDGQLISKIESMQNQKGLWLVLSVVAVAAWVVCLMITGRLAGWAESVDITIALVVIWGCLVLLHQRTHISMGLGAVLCNFSQGAACAVAILLTEWSLRDSSNRLRQLGRWTIAFGLLYGILAIELRDQLGFTDRNREAIFAGFAFLVVCVLVSVAMKAWLSFRSSKRVALVSRRTQWSISKMLWWMGFVAVACSLLNFAAAQVRVDWLWVGKFLLVHLPVIVVGQLCCSVWRNPFVQAKSLPQPRRNWSFFVSTSIFVFAIASASVTALLGSRFLSLWSFFFYDGDFCLWYTVGFTSLFSILLYRTLPLPDLEQHQHIASESEILGSLTDVECQDSSALSRIETPKPEGPVFQRFAGQSLVGNQLGT
jgi:hypothetical protein